MAMDADSAFCSKCYKKNNRLMGRRRCRCKLLMRQHNWLTHGVEGCEWFVHDGCLFIANEQVEKVNTV